MALANHCNLLGRAPTASSLQIGNVDGPASGGSTDKALVRWNGTTGRLVQNGVVTEADFTGALTGGTDQATTTAVGLAFTNQPANDGVEVLSSNAGDTTQTVTIIGTTNGTDTVVVETVTLNGTTAVPTVKTDWGVVLAVKKSAVTLGTVTVREASADQTITAGLTAAVLSVGVTTVTNTAAYNQLVSMVADGATTKQFGFQGTNSSGTVIYDSQALTGATAALTNSQFLTITELYRGDLEVARTVTVTTNGSWTLTGGGGATLSFDTLTGGITATPSGTGNVVMVTGGTNSIKTGRNSGATTYSILSFNNGFTTATVSGISGGGDNDMFYLATSTGAHHFYFAGTEKIKMAGTTGNLLLGGLTTDGTGVLQFLSAATSAGGIAFGTDTFLYRSGNNTLAVDTVAGASADLVLRRDAGSGFARLGTTGTGGDNLQIDAVRGALILRTNGTTTAVTIDTSQNATFAGFIRPVNLATASAPAYAKGVIYFDTTLNKLRVGGATAFETITSV